MIPSQIKPSHGLDIAEALLSEISVEGLSGVYLSKDCESLLEKHSLSKLGDMAKVSDLGLPSLSEPQVMRHFTRLSSKNFSIDHGMYPLGSCTMKYNPRINEAAARIPGFTDTHPLQPEETIQGNLELLDTLAKSILELTGMEAITLAPAGGSHGEHTGLMAIKAALEAKGMGDRDVCLMPESAHGTNPASAHLCGFRIHTIGCNPDGTVNMDEFKEALETLPVGCMMLTNPNTVGIFESEIKTMTKMLHDVGGLFYMDGANMNALMGQTKVSEMQIDAMHLNVHKTLSTPHGGGGPGAGPVVFSAACAAHAPVPRIVFNDCSQEFEVETNIEGSIGRVKDFFGQFGVLVRTLAYMLALGGDGLRQSSSDAVLNANYMLARLSDLTPAIEGRKCMHEFALSDKHLSGTGVSTMDLAKSLCDYGFHPSTVYFPLFVSGSMLIEPTESESIESMDSFCDKLIELSKQAHEDPHPLHEAPLHCPVRRVDEVGAAKKPILKW